MLGHLLDEYIPRELPLLLNSFFWFSCCGVSARLHWLTPRDFYCLPKHVPKLVCPRGYIAPVCVCSSCLSQQVYNRLNCGRNIGSYIVSQPCNKQRARELTRRSKTRAPTGYMTTGFGSSGYVPGESQMHCVGSAEKAALEAQHATMLHSCAT